jgi:hypothetical protein
MDSSRIESLLEESIRASNRTTHAVRAFVRFLFIQLVAITISGFVIAFANLVDPVEPPVILLVFAGAIWVGGVIFSSIEGWAEVAKSNVPGDSDGEPARSEVSQEESEFDAHRFSRLTGRQKDAWRQRALPDLRTWNFDEESFEEWLERQ